MNNPTHSLRFMLFLLLSSIGLIISGVFVGRLNNPTSLDNRSQAQQSNPNPELTISTNPTNPVVGEPLTLNFNLNTKSFDTTGLQMFGLAISTNIPSLNLPTSLTHIEPTLSPATNTISSNTVNYLSILSNFTTPLNTNNSTIPIASISITPQSAGTIGFAFDSAQTIVNQYNDSSGANILQSPQDKTITIAAAPTCIDNNDVCDSDSCNYNQDACNNQNGNDNNDDDQAIGGDTLDTCTIPYAPQRLTARSGLNPGEIIVNWIRPGGESYFAVSFGEQPGVYKWGSTNIGNTRAFTIRFLEPGKRYYTSVATINNCGGIKFASEVSAIARPNPQDRIITSPTPVPIPEIILDSEPNTATPPASPLTTPTPDETPETAHQTLLQRLLSNKALLSIIVIIVLVIGISRLRRKKPPLPPKVNLPTNFKSSDFKPQPQPDNPENNPQL